MSALEQSSIQTAIERRRSERTQVNRVLRARTGRHDAFLVDLSMRGARIRHEGLLRRGATVRLAFGWEDARFDGAVEVLASRIVTLGAHENQPAVYESRVRFASMTADAMELLARVIGGLAAEELRTWVGNLQGDNAPLSHGGPQPLGFIRCRYVHRRWEMKWTREASQPSDGFTLPAGTARAEVDALCAAWEGMDDDSRHLVRITANVVAQQTTYVQTSVCNGGNT